MMGSPFGTPRGEKKVRFVLYDPVFSLADDLFFSFCRMILSFFWRIILFFLRMIFFLVHTLVCYFWVYRRPQLEVDVLTLSSKGAYRFREKCAAV